VLYALLNVPKSMTLDDWSGRVIMHFVCTVLKTLFAEATGTAIWSYDWIGMLFLLCTTRTLP